MAKLVHGKDCKIEFVSEDGESRLDEGFYSYKILDVGNDNVKITALAYYHEGYEAEVELGTEGLIEIKTSEITGYRGHVKLVSWAIYAHVAEVIQITFIFEEATLERLTTFENPI